MCVCSKVEGVGSFLRFRDICTLSFIVIVSRIQSVGLLLRLCRVLREEAIRVVKSAQARRHQNINLGNL